VRGIGSRALQENSLPVRLEVIQVVEVGRAGSGPAEPSDVH
jgi:hypothetical protein